MKASPFLALALLCFTAQAQVLPAEVTRFLQEREMCEHFLGEPVEGQTPADRKRRAFVADSVDIHCAGTDKQLAALKRRYAGNKAAMAALRLLEEKLE